MRLSQQFLQIWTTVYYICLCVVNPNTKFSPCVWWSHFTGRCKSLVAPCCTVCFHGNFIKYFCLLWCMKYIQMSSIKLIIALQHRVCPIICCLWRMTNAKIPFLLTKLMAHQNFTSEIPLMGHHLFSASMHFHKKNN